MMTISLDPSINNTGFAIFKDKLLIQSGTIKTPSALEPQSKIGCIVATLHEMLSRIDAVVLEVPRSFTYGRSSRGGKGLNATSMQKLNWVVGSIIAVARICECRLHTIPPDKWKGRRSKKWDQIATGISNPDEADSVAMGQWWLRIGKQIADE